MLKVRIVHLQLANGAQVVGVVPAIFTDEELAQPGVISVTFSDTFVVEPQTTIKKLLQKLSAVALGLVH